MKTTAIFGPPGTGKTSELVRIINSIKNRADMAVVSFSRAAASELLSRHLEGDAPAFVGTIHSFCFRQLGLDRSQVVSSFYQFQQDTGYFSDDFYQAIEIVQFARRRKASLAWAYQYWRSLSVSYDTVERMNAMYNGWKEHYGMLDFDDMLDQAKGHTQKFQTVIVDEAQDLSKMQWDVILSMVKPTGKLIVGGDDDQAIYSWAGAYPHGMRDIATEMVVLGQSYRVPIVVHQAAMQTVDLIQDRQVKKYLPTTNLGYVKVYGSYSPWIAGGYHTVMCRDRYVMKDIERDIIEAGVPYEMIGAYGPGLFIGKAAQIKKAVETKNIDKLQKLKSKMNAYGKAVVDAGEIPDWRSTLDVDDETIHYLERVDVSTQPRLTISTIHQQKGKEFDHGVIIAHCSPKVESLQERAVDFDDEIRVWYTALTRVKRGVTIVGSNPYIRF